MERSHFQTGRGLVCTGLVVAMAAAGAMATTYTVPICTDQSFYEGTTVSFEVNLGTTLQSVQQVAFSFDGSVTAGLDGYYTPYGNHLTCRLSPASASTPTAGAVTYPSPQPVSGAVNLSFGGTWSFLLDGVASGTLELPFMVQIPENPPIRARSRARLNSASLIIEATPTPEPASLLLVLAGAARLVVRRKRTA